MITENNRELAFYYPNPMWVNGDWIKNLVLFFDGVALLLPSYMRERPEQLDAPTVVGLREQDLLEIIEPEHAVDRSATEELATEMANIITSGVLDELAEEATAFHSLSMSRLGLFGDEGLYKMIFDELKDRGLATDSEDGVSVPLHPMVRSLVLVLLSQILRPYGKRIQATLSPATDRAPLVNALSELLSHRMEASVASVIEFDLNTVTVDLAAVPFDEVLDFRKQYLDEHRRYVLHARKFAMELSRMPHEERELAFEIRQTELNDLAGDLRSRARKSWKRPRNAASRSASPASATSRQSGSSAIASRRKSLANRLPSKGRTIVIRNLPSPIAPSQLGPAVQS